MEDKNNNTRSQPHSRPGLLTLLLWRLPLQLIGTLIAAWFLSLLAEYAGMLFFWPEAGASHAYSMMIQESDYLSNGFTRSLLMSRPAITTLHWISRGYQWIQTHLSGLNGTSSLSLSPLFSMVPQAGTWLTAHLHDWLLAAVYITVVFAMRVTILVLSVPLFILVIIVATVEGLSRRDLRRYGAGYESSFLYHHARRAVKPASILPCMIYLSWPLSIHPNFVLLPAALLTGISMTIMTSSFKKYI